MSAAGAVDKLTQLVAIKADIYAALAEVGAPVGEGQTFADVPALIRAVGSDTVVPSITVEVDGALNSVAEPTIGDTLTLSAPTFAPNDADTSVAFKLQRRIPGQAWEDVAHDFGGGAYTFVAGDMGRQFTGLWTASRAGFASKSFRSPAVAPLALTFLADPVVAGISRVGDVLSVDLEVYPSDASAAYQWRINGVNVADETDPTYTVLLADHGKVPSVEITATEGAQSKTFTASALAVVHAAPVVVEQPAAVELTQADGETTVISVSNIFDGRDLRYFVRETLPEEGDDIPEDPEDPPVDISSPFIVTDPITGALTVDRTYIQSAEITLVAYNDGGEAEVEFPISIVADAGSPAEAPPALEVGDWTISASLQTPVMARARVVLTSGNPADIQWTKVAAPVEADWKPMVPDNGAFLAFCPEGTCEEPVGTTDAYYLRYRNNATGLWSAISDGKTFTVTAATITPAGGSFTYPLYRGVVNPMDLAKLFSADFPVEITIDDADMPMPFTIDADGMASVTVMPGETLGERTVTVTAEFVGVTPPPPVEMVPEFIGESYTSSDEVALPVDMLADDIVFMAARGPDTMPVPSGWNVIYNSGSETIAGVLVRLVYAWKRADSPTMASGEWTGAARLLATVYRNLDPTAPIGTPVSGTTSSASTVTYPALPGLEAGAWAMAMQYTQGNVEAPAHPALVTRRVGPGSGFNRLRVMDSAGDITALAEAVAGTIASVSNFRVTLFKLNPKAV